MTPAHIAKVLLVTASLLADINSVTQASRQQASLLQVKKTKGLSKSCDLPDGGTWAEVRLTGLPAFRMAVRNEKDPLSEELRNDKGHWEVEDVSVWGEPGEALDIGGNIGYYTFALAQAGWNVTTFEPMDRNTQFIEATLCENPEIASRVKLLKIGLGAQNQVCAMITLPDNVGNGCVRCSGDANKGADLANPWDESQYVTAGDKFQIRRLEEVLKEESINRVDFVKLDIEGYECEALRGAGDFLERYHPRLVKNEIWQSMERCLSTEYFKMYENAGYRFGWDDDPECRKKEITDGDKYYGGNFYMCKD